VCHGAHCGEGPVLTILAMLAALRVAAGGSARRVGAGITPPRLSQNRTCGPRIRLLGSVYQNPSDCWADAVGELRSCQRVCSETIRPVNQDGG